MKRAGLVLALAVMACGRAAAPILGVAEVAAGEQARPPPLPDDAAVTLAATAATWMFRLAVVALALTLLRAAPRAYGAGFLLIVAGEASAALDVLFAGGGGVVSAVARVTGVAAGLALLGRAHFPKPPRALAVPLAALALLPFLFPLRPETLIAALRVVPVAAAALLLVSAAGVRGAFGAGAGLAAYGLLRLAIAEALPDRPVLASSVEETILLACLAIALIFLRRAEVRTARP